VAAVAPPVALKRFIRFGKIRHAFPHYVVQDEEDLVVLYMPLGTVGMRPRFDASSPIRGQADRDWEMYEHEWHTSSQLTLIQWRRAHALELLWDERGEFVGWYVNMQEPLRRAPLGFETDDLILDIRVEPDGSWAWKDEDELEQAVELGRFTPPEAAEIRAEGERVIEERQWPTGWEDWRPDPSWGLPKLPPGWDVV
jgi:predicted RNA-binding protein associated with RNAse of E/G family